MVAAFTFRPAVRENTPLIIGVAGPTKSGKTYSALRLARGLLPPGREIAMINAEGARGHQYAEKFRYLTTDITPPYRPERYTEALLAAAQIDPGAIIVDSASHMHDGPGGLLEYHEEELARLARGRDDDRDKYNFVAWVKPKAAENAFIYTMLSMKCPVILCFRAKEKIKIVQGQKPVDLGWQPIAGERIAFETLFTLMLPPHSKGVPDQKSSDMREPFDTLVDWTRPIDEKLGEVLAQWSRGRSAAVSSALLEEIQAQLVKAYPGQTAEDKEAKAALLAKAFGSRSWAVVKDMDTETLRAGLIKLTAPADVQSSPRTAAQGRLPGGGTVHGDAADAEKPQAEAFPTRSALRPTPAPASVQVPGIDVDDPSQVLVKAIEAEKGKLERQPSDAQWSAVCQGIAGTEVLDMADPEALQQLLDLVKGLVVGDPDAVERAGALIAPKAKGAGQ